jgi:hypothetical protein
MQTAGFNAPRVSLETVTPPVFGKENHMGSPFEKGSDASYGRQRYHLPLISLWGRLKLNNIASLLLCALLLSASSLLVFPAPALAASLTLSPNRGSFGTVITVTGGGFPADTDGWVWFDSVRNSARDDGEPQMEVTTTGAGAIPDGVILTVPELTAGSYFVLADIPVGIPREGFAFFTYTGAYISLDPQTGYSGTVITITGGNFTPAGSAGWLWFDTDRDGIRDPEEPQVAVTATGAGDLPDGVTLTAPALTQGTEYWVRADIPGGGSYEASAIFKCPLATTELTVTKYDPYGEVLGEPVTITYQEMMALPQQGDGSRHYWLQGPVLPEYGSDIWDPTETFNIKDYGANKGTDLKDLCELVGGMSPGDTVAVKGSDGVGRTYDYPNVYTPEPEQGKMVIYWYTKGGVETGYPDGAYVPEFAEGMRLGFFAETTNSEGKYVFGNWDQHECFPQSRWYFYNGEYPTTTGHSVKYVSEINIYQPNLVSCDSAGNKKDAFAPGETVYVQGMGLAGSTGYKLWIQDEPIIDNDTLNTGEDPSGTQETVTTDGNGDFGPLELWTIDTAATPHKYDIIAENQTLGVQGKYENDYEHPYDFIDDPAWQGFEVTEVSEFISFTIEDYDDDGIIFGDLDPGQTDQPADWGGGGGAVTITVGAETSVDVDVQVMGTDFSRITGGGTIPIASVKYDDDDDPGGASTLTDAYVTWYSVEAHTSDVRQVYYWLTIPPGQSAGDYESTFYYQAVKK